MAKTVKQLIADRDRIKGQIHKKQDEIVSMKKVLKQTRKDIKAAKALKVKAQVVSSTMETTVQ